jgi:hypothetical protein
MPSIDQYIALAATFQPSTVVLEEAASRDADDYCD